MVRLTLSQQNALKTGTAYGLGLVLGFIIALIIFNTLQLKWIPIENEVMALVIGVVLAIIIMSFAAGIAGYIGGHTLQNPTKTKSQRKLAFRSALSLGIPFGLLIFPVILLISVAAFYGTSDVTPFSFSLSFMILGAIYGVIAGLVLGLSTVGRGFFTHILEACLVGYALGGLALGLCVYAYLITVSARGSGSIFSFLLVLVGMFLFNGIGGFAIGGIFSELTNKAAFAEPGPLTKAQRIRRIIWVGISVFLLLFLVSSFEDVVADVFTPQDANLATILDSTTIGTHWTEAEMVANARGLENDAQPDIFVTDDGQASLVWLQDGEVFWAEGGDTGWQPPVQVTNGANLDTAVPQTIIDNNSTTQIIWADGDGVWLSQCAAGNCSEPASIATAADNTCGSENDLQSPVIALNNEQVMTIWSTGDALAYAAWDTDAAVPSTPTGCIVTEEAAISSLSLAGSDNGRFALVYQSGNTIRQTRFNGENWAAAAAEIGTGSHPDVLLGDAQKAHIIWCNDNNDVTYWTERNASIVSGASCASGPELGIDENGRLHIIWYANQSQNQFSQFQDNHILYETILDDDTWQLAAVVQQPDAATIPTMNSTPGGGLHLAWINDDTVYYAQQQQYQCDQADLPPFSQLVLDIAQQYHTSDTIIPFCNNHYDRFIVTPNPEAAYSDWPQTPNGGFDVAFDLVREAKYEVLFSTMWYDRDEGLDSPGYLLAEAVADLYNNLKAHPEQYPRGMTVRILLGNPPEATRAEFSDQVWSALTDLHNAGVPEMINEELGWRVEVADYKGALPHSHAKMMVIDGKTAVAAGYNMSYEHFPADHPSGLGSGRFDLGLQITGPVAQDAHRAFDDIWTGSDQRTCRDLSLPDGEWQDTCIETKAISDHVPEVLKYTVTDSGSNAFSMYRNVAYPESDRQIEALFSNAQQTIDAMHVNFTMPMICDLNLLYNVCDFDNATPYLESLMQAAENGAKIRLILKAQPLDGVETSVAVRIIQQEIEERELEESFEFRYFDGPMHPKSALIDQQYVVVGSQNLHYSAFGDDTGLVEYSLGTDNPQAVADYQSMFDYYWERSIP